MPQVEIKQISGTANQPTWQAKVQMQLGKKMIRERWIGEGKKKEIEKEACMRMIHELQSTYTIKHHTFQNIERMTGIIHYQLAVTLSIS